MNVHKPSLIRDLIIIISGIIIAGLLYTFSAAYLARPGQAPSGEVPEAGSIALTGTMVCLPHKDSLGPQTLECAFGLQDEQGLYYGLRDTDPSYHNVSSIPMNVPVQVEGTFTPQTDTRYQSVGVIDVTRITPTDSPRRMGISGVFECLPHKAGEAPTKECKLGLKTDDAKHYVIDFGPLSQSMPTPKVGDALNAEGIYTPIEQLSTDQWQKYAIDGIFSVTNIIDENYEAPVLQ